MYASSSTKKGLWFSVCASVIAICSRTAILSVGAVGSLIRDEGYRDE
ncbi:MAG TPA: hypothetical protein VNO21_02505 [Polyangiaceae bacterium]|nr:hypothetical protein [Polyangiaceae bacterium]